MLRWNPVESTGKKMNESSSVIEAYPSQEEETTPSAYPHEE